MMINGFNPGFSMMPMRSGSQSAPLARQSVQPAPLPTGNRMASTLARQSFNETGFLSGFGNLAFGMGQMARSATQEFGNLFGSLGQMGGTVISSFSLPSLNAFQPTQRGQKIQPPQQDMAMQNTRRTGQQIFQSVSAGANQAIRDIGGMITENAPAALGFGGAMGSAGAVCTYMCGAMAASGAAMLMNQNHGQAA